VVISDDTVCHGQRRADTICHYRGISACSPQLQVAENPQLLWQAVYEQSIGYRGTYGHPSQLLVAVVHANAGR